MLSALIPLGRGWCNASLAYTLKGFVFNGAEKKRSILSSLYSTILPSSNDFFVCFEMVLRELNLTQSLQHDQRVSLIMTELLCFFLLRNFCWDVSETHFNSITFAAVEVLDWGGFYSFFFLKLERWKFIAISFEVKDVYGNLLTTKLPLL